MRGALPNSEATLLLLGRVAITRKAYERKVPKLNYETIKFIWEDSMGKPSSATLHFSFPIESK